mmetsp:Transcript_24995/g.64959  ORF Transcript_24995/g.64959 Transcript_24995/m.64959 type:complete len:462 (-) Transcript_24995:2436-3821(-)
MHRRPGYGNDGRWCRCHRPARCARGDRRRGGRVQGDAGHGRYLPRLDRHRRRHRRPHGLRRVHRAAGQPRAAHVRSVGVEPADDRELGRRGQRPGRRRAPRLGHVHAELRHRRERRPLDDGAHRGGRDGRRRAAGAGGPAVARRRHGDGDAHRPVPRQEHRAAAHGLRQRDAAERLGGPLRRALRRVGLGLLPRRARRRRAPGGGRERAPLRLVALRAPGGAARRRDGGGQGHDGQPDHRVDRRRDRRARRDAPADARLRHRHVRDAAHPLRLRRRPDGPPRRRRRPGLPGRQLLDLDAQRGHGPLGDDDERLGHDGPHGPQARARGPAGHQERPHGDGRQRRRRLALLRERGHQRVRLGDHRLRPEKQVHAAGLRVLRRDRRPRRGRGDGHGRRLAEVPRRRRLRAQVHADGGGQLHVHAQGLARQAGHGERHGLHPHGAERRPRRRAGDGGGPAVAPRA